MRLHVKRPNEKEQFLYEATVTTPVADAISEIVEIHNLRMRAERLATHCDDLVKHGPMRPESEHGLDEFKDLSVEDKTSCADFDYNADPCGRRNGRAPKADKGEIITKTVQELRACVSGDKVKQNVVLTKEAIQEALDGVKGAVMIVYPMGLPEFDPVRQAIEDNEDLSGQQASKDVLDPKTATLWCFGKELIRGKQLKDYVGSNEKTKVIAKLQGKGAGPPAREPAVDPETQKRLMTQYYKRQEELKKLEEDQEDTTGVSPWADPKSLKNAFQGTQGVGWKIR